MLHDWDDESCVKILRNVRAGMGARARVAIIEMVIPEQLVAGPAPLMDLNMMVMLGAKERTAAEYGALFARADLTTSRVIPTSSPWCEIVLLSAARFWPRYPCFCKGSK